MNKKTTNENTKSVVHGDDPHDVEGHLRFRVNDEGDDDVEGHVQPPRDLDIEC